MCVIVLLHRKQRRKGVSHSVRGVLKVDATEHILVRQMSHQQGVAGRYPSAPPARVSSSASRSWWTSENSHNHHVDCSTSGLCVQPDLISQISHDDSVSNVCRQQYGLHCGVGSAESPATHG